MLHICNQANRHLYKQQLSQMHRQRNELFVKTKGWNLKVIDGGEYDEGDDDRAIYLLSLDEIGNCFGSIRVRPADDFSMVIDKMPHHVAGDAAELRKDPHLWEMARWVNVGNDRAAGEETRIGLIEYLLSQGCAQCLALPDIGMLAYAIRTGWRARAIGAPTPYPEGGVAVAVSLPITAEEVAHVRRVTGRSDAFLIDIDPAAPWAQTPLPVIEAIFKAQAASGVSQGELGICADARLRATPSPKAA